MPDIYTHGVTAWLVSTASVRGGGAGAGHRPVRGVNISLRHLHTAANWRLYGGNASLCSNSLGPAGGGNSNRKVKSEIKEFLCWVRWG